MISRATLALLSLGALLVPGLAAAKPCGDDVNGQDVPCACGDTLVSSVVLADDPVTGARCPGDGLVVRAGGARPGITIDLHGATLRGSGDGTGLWVVFGGSGGARVISTGGPARIEQYHDGVIGDGPEAIALIDGVVVRSSIRDGIRLHRGTAEIRNGEARDSGRDGFSVMAGRFTMTSNRSVHSGRYGFWLMGNGLSIGAPGAGIVSEGSGDSGIAIMGMGNRLIDCASSGSEEHGVDLYGMHIWVEGCVATGNHGDGIKGMGMAWFLMRNQATDNDRNGILVSGPDVEDEGGNSGSGNRGLGQQRPVVQCEINGIPCQP
jgi:hypothetical protein